MRTPRLVLLTAAAALSIAAGCSEDVAAPGGPTIAGSPVSPATGLFSVSPGATATEDSVIAGYGNEACGGLEYQSFEYDPATGTEYIVCKDTTIKRDTTLKPTPTSPAPTSPAPTSPTPAPK